MGTIADLFPPDTEICQLPSGTPPNGQLPNFDDPGLKAVTISISVILTTITVVISLGRLHTNLRKLTWTDLFVLLAMALNVADTIVMIIFVKYFRHIWNLPLCWFNGQYGLLVYVWQTLMNLSLFFSKTATLILFRQIFATSRAMNIAIWIGVLFCFATYTSGLVVTSYFSAPHVGSTWDQVAANLYGPTVFLLYWSIAQGSASTLLDVYIFILPLPVLARLHLSTKRKIQIIAIFGVGLLGVLAGIISLVYRVKSIQESVSDATYNAGIIFLNWYVYSLHRARYFMSRDLTVCVANFSLVEMDIALIICSAPAFTSFLRASVLDSRAFTYLRAKLGRGDPNGADITGCKLRDPNQPRTGRKNAPNQHPTMQSDDGYKTSDTWLFNSGTTTDIEALKSTPAATDSDWTGGPSVVTTVNVERTHASSGP
ncbi:hypothetical protein F4823DRAFT_174883 [Ustulina deusta]|nr:hypothetical protein F4823DRAFT_174883 [Ustulina deusta]